MQKDLVQETLEVLCRIESKWARVGRTVWRIFPPYSSVREAPLPTKVRHLFPNATPTVSIIVELPCPRHTQLVLRSTNVITEAWLRFEGVVTTIGTSAIVDEEGKSVIRITPSTDIRINEHLIERSSYTMKRIRSIIKRSTLKGERYSGERHLEALKEELERFEEWLWEWATTLSPAIWLEDQGLAAYIGAAFLEERWGAPCPLAYITKALQLVQLQAIYLFRAQSSLQIDNKHYIVARNENGVPILRLEPQGLEADLYPGDIAYALYKILPGKEPHYLSKLLRKLLRWRDAIAELVIADVEAILREIDQGGSGNG